MGYGLEALDTYAFPMRLTEDEPMRVQGNCWLFVVRKRSPYAQVCMEFLGDLLYVADPTARRNACLYQNVAQQQFTPPEGEDGYVLVPQWMGKLPSGVPLFPVQFLQQRSGPDPV